MSPLSATDTFRSLMWCVAPSRVIFTTRFSALPYWFCPSITGRPRWEWSVMSASSLGKRSSRTG